MMKLSDILSKYHAKIYILTPDHILSKDFNCDNKHRASFQHHKLNECLFKYGKLLTKYRRSKITIIENDDKIIAYYSLAHDSLHIKDDEEFHAELKKYIKDEDREFIQKYSTQLDFPAIKIEQLAVDKEFQSQQIGASIISTIIGEVIANENWYGCQYLTVDTLNNTDTNKFYLNNGFTYVSNNDMQASTRKMYLSLLPYFGI